MARRSVSKENSVVTFPAQPQAFITSRQLAEETGLTHAWLKRSIKKRLDHLAHGGDVLFRNGEYVLNVQQAWLFVSFLRISNRPFPLLERIVDVLCAEMRRVGFDPIAHINNGGVA